jgi:hypothetical protein
MSKPKKNSLPSSRMQDTSPLPIHSIQDFNAPVHTNNSASPAQPDEAPMPPFITREEFEGYTGGLNDIIQRLQQNDQKRDAQDAQISDALNMLNKAFVHVRNTLGSIGESLVPYISPSQEQPADGDESNDSAG